MLDVDVVQQIEVKIPKGYKHKEWQSTCKVGRNIYIFGGINSHSDLYNGKLIRFNIDGMATSVHESINKINSRIGHACSYYSNFNNY